MDGRTDEYRVSWKRNSPADYQLHKIVCRVIPLSFDTISSDEIGKLLVLTIS